METSWLEAEQSHRKLMVALSTQEHAEHTKSQLTQLFGDGGGWVSLVAPDDPAIDRKLEPEVRRIAGTAIWSHGIAGLIGFAIGVLIWGVAYWLSVALIVSTPGMSFFAIVLITTFLGLLAGGAITFRPDHNTVILPAKDASAEGKWVVVAHPTNDTEAQRAEDYLKRVDEESFHQTLG